VETDTKSLTYLDTHGFVPGVDAEVRAKAANGTLTLAVDDGTLSIEPDLAAQLFVAAG
ncbi:MAG: ferrous iron transport protein A, partial [Acidimicrobiia bacterium]|nr:ferrous iron transport protein A [Acidimicrobiia bacterium]